MTNIPENPFKPKLGKPGNRGDRFSKRVLKKVRSLSHGMSRPSSDMSEGRSGYTGERIGRGHWAGRYSNSQYGKSAVPAGARQVIIKGRIIKLAGTSYSRAMSHLQYIEREGVGQDGKEAESYGKFGDDIDLKEFQNRSEGDRHQFRFIVSAEDGVEIEDHKSFTRDLMAKMEQDLQTKLDWVAVDHFDTDHPHTHLVLRGVDDKGKDLIIAKSYMSYGMRNMASDILTQELGPRTEMEILQQVRRQVDQDRLTDIDRDIINYSRAHMMHPDGGTYSANLVTARLKKLSKMGLAQYQGSNYWRLSPNMKDTLQMMGERGDIIKILHRNLYGAGKDNLKQKALIFGLDATSQNHITGELIKVGLSDELNDRRYIILDGTDGNHWYVDMGELEQISDLNQGMIISVKAAHKQASQVDHRIAAIAHQNGGIYSEGKHRDFDPKASAAYIQSHVRRLESLRRYGIGEREKGGIWRIPPDFTNCVEKLQKQFAQKAPMAMTINSAYALDQLVDGEGYGWLDRNLDEKEKTGLFSGGFGRKVRQALAQRRSWLLRQGLIQQKGARFLYPKDFAAKLAKREMTKIAVTIAKQTGKKYSPMGDKGDVSGTYVRKLNLKSGQYAILEKSKEFTLVPWRPVMERAKGQVISGMISRGNISWSIGQGVWF
ncbi:DUF3363 domain-containing protein [Paremcibacter congregatus]|uniref:Conjugal transfer protein TraI n=1 Tax=Paremcibacter congregatus TaxID=2043170 RepID=A0A2G4YWZ4_9PROT|nr:DUF3363 domain-containing protein [Paremcibacter congregatus]PHZ86763.1 conjugal transfer protein TraI [Paremcibacter congregatus]QDE26275.1 DUF3363 domain-containing protein [Paremcibacter congregatus]QDE28018.1 DUF3363 domain-containing protein [Paremcibacter congregatus]